MFGTLNGYSAILIAIFAVHRAQNLAKYRKWFYVRIQLAIEAFRLRNT